MAELLRPCVCVQVTGVGARPGTGSVAGHGPAACLALIDGHCRDGRLEHSGQTGFPASEPSQILLMTTGYDFGQAADLSGAIGRREP